MPASCVENTMMSGERQWHSVQCFGVRTPAEQVNFRYQKTRLKGQQVEEADIISTMDFDISGEFLATGDKGGRVVIFERVPYQGSLTPHPNSPSSPSGRCKQRPPSFEYK